MNPRKPGRPKKADYVTYKEAGAMLGVSEYTIVDMVKDGRLAAYETKGGRHKLLRTTVQDYAESNRI